MKRTSGVVLGALLAAAALSLTACDPSVQQATDATKSVAGTVVKDLAFNTGTAVEHHAPANTGDFFHGPPTSPQAQKWVQLSAGSAGGLNPVVVNGAGFTLYRFDKDGTAPAKSNCDGACATTWPPVLVHAGTKIFLDGVPKNEIGVVKRTDGDLQLTIADHPIYRFAKDTAPGQANGEGVGGTWFGIAPSGDKATKAAPTATGPSGINYLPGTAKQHHAPTNTGDDAKHTSPAAKNWVQLSAGSAGGLSPIVHDGAGFTLYRFDKDTPSPSKSNCDGACATTWPPVLVHAGTKVFLDGVPASGIGVVRRTDGDLQLTIGGWPLYRFSGDTAAGQTNGEGVGGIWFAVSPQGAKTLPINISGTTPGAAPSASASTGSGY